MAPITARKSKNRYMASMFVKWALMYISLARFVFGSDRPLLRPTASPYFPSSLSISACTARLIKLLRVCRAFVSSPERLTGTNVNVEKSPSQSMTSGQISTELAARTGLSLVERVMYLQVLDVRGEWIPARKIIKIEVDPGEDTAFMVFAPAL